MIVYLLIYLACIIFIQAFAIISYDAKSDEEHGIRGWDYFMISLLSPLFVILIIFAYFTRL